MSDYDDDDGQPSELTEWEDYEGPQEYQSADVYENDPWNVAREEFKKKRMSKKALEKTKDKKGEKQ